MESLWTDDCTNFIIFDHKDESGQHVIGLGATQQGYRIRNKDLQYVLDKNHQGMVAIQRASKALIRVGSDLESDAVCHSFIDIIGTHEQISHAKMLIEQKVGEIHNWKCAKPLMPRNIFVVQLGLPDHKVIPSISGLETVSGTWIKPNFPSHASAAGITNLQSSLTLSGPWDCIEQAVGIIQRFPKAAPENGEAPELHEPKEPKWSDLFGGASNGHAVDMNNVGWRLWKRSSPMPASESSHQIRAEDFSFLEGWLDRGYQAINAFGFGFIGVVYGLRHFENNLISSQIVSSLTMIAFACFFFAYFVNKGKAFIWFVSLGVVVGVGLLMYVAASYGWLYQRSTDSFSTCTYADIRTRIPDTISGDSNFEPVDAPSIRLTIKSAGQKEVIDNLEITLQPMPPSVVTFEVEGRDDLHIDFRNDQVSIAGGTYLHTGVQLQVVEMCFPNMTAATKTKKKKGKQKAEALSHTSESLNNPRGDIRETVKSLESMAAGGGPTCPQGMKSMKVTTMQQVLSKLVLHYTVKELAPNSDVSALNHLSPQMLEKTSGSQKTAT